MLKLISFLYHDMIAKRKKEKRKENAREAHLKRRMLMFEKRSKRKWHERKDSLQNKITQARKKSRDRKAITHDCSLLHSLGTSINFYASRGSLLFLPLCTY